MDDSSIRPAFNKLTFDQVVLDTSLKLREAQAHGQTEVAYEYFKWMLNFLSNHIPLESRKNLEEDMLTFVNQLVIIEKDKLLNESTKEIRINKLKQIFMETHTRYIMLAFPRASITKVSDEAAVDFTELDYNLAKKIIRATPMKRIYKEINEKFSVEEDEIIKGSEIDGTTTDPEQE